MTAPNSVLQGNNIFRVGEQMSSLFSDALSAFWDGGGSAVATSKKFYFYVPVALKIEGWALFCDVSATIQIDVWQALIANGPPTVSNTICNGNYIATTAATQNQLISSSTALGFATSLNVGGQPIIPAGSAVIFNVKANDNATIIGAQLICRSGS